MARVIGGTKTWLWWLGGALCALLFGGVEPGQLGQAQEVYGVRPRPRPASPKAKPEDKKKAAALVDQYFGPVKPAEPKAGEAARIKALVKKLSSAQFAVRNAASKALVGFGTVALPALNEALKSKDPEVAQRAKQIISSIETAARKPIAAKLKTMRAAAAAVISERRMRLGKTYREAMTAERNAARAGDKEAEAKAQAKKKEVSARMLELNRLSAVLGLFRPVAVYGVRAPR
jgi:hypothetical protein